MDRRKEMLLDALKAAALERGEVRLYRRGKLPGLVAQRTRLHAEIATQAVQDGLLESVRVESAGPTAIEWVRITQKGLDFLLDSESPARALEAVRAELALNLQGLPAWSAQMRTRFDEMTRVFTDEVAAMRHKLEQLSQRVTEAIERLDTKTAGATTVPWARGALDHLERRQQVGLGRRRSLADLFAALRDQQADLTIKDFHAGLRVLRERGLLQLLPSVAEGDAPGPEYALLDGAAVHYYVGLIDADLRSGP